MVVGAGMSGLTTALELGRAGARVAVVDRASVFGGHAVMANGDLNIVDTPLQRSRGIRDSAELAIADMKRWGGSSATEWVRYYAENSRVEILEWLAELGVEFENVLPGPDNSVPRVHLTKGRGIGLVTPVYLACLNHPNISFHWNSRVRRLEVVKGRVGGLSIEDERTGLSAVIASRTVVLATGGFQNNLEMVRDYWSRGLPFPDSFLTGSGVHSTGEGHRLAQAAGAELVAMNHQMNLATGIRDPRYPAERRGLNARNGQSIWVNQRGERFINESTPPTVALETVIRQPGSTYWAIFDADGRAGMRISGSDWRAVERIERTVLDNPAMVAKADSVAELARLTGLPVAALQTTVDTYNAMVEQGRDSAFQRFAPGQGGMGKKLVRPPFHALQFFPLTRKSMGGVAIDRDCRVLDADGKVVPGLFAVGELTGSALMNGREGMSGMFLGPCIVTARVASRAIARELVFRPQAKPGREDTSLRALPARSAASDTQTCLQCHDLPQLVSSRRPGYWHFEYVHAQVMERRRSCADCHGEIAIVVDTALHRANPRSLAHACAQCHIAVE